jgi:hypothetical protein
MEIEVAKKAKKKIVRREYTKADVKELRAHSKAKTPLAKIMKSDQENGRVIAPEGIEAWDSARSSQVKRCRC